MQKIEAFGNYDIIVDCEISHLKNWLNNQNYSAHFVLVDENTKQHCLPKLANSIADLLVIEIEAGEAHKSIQSFEKISKDLLNANANRQALLINLGGGVIGDMGGFAAGCYKRGIDFIQIPTTLLSMVDASVGGKTGINFSGVKNQLGLFAQPKMVWANPEFLATLPKRHLVNGFAEIIKHNILSGENLTDNYITDLIKDADGLIELVTNAVQFKNNVVTKDYRETGPRKQLNFGHTIGHTFESYSLKNDDDPLFHGEAIASGMLFELLLCEAKQLTDSTSIKKIENIILHHFQPYKIASINFNELIELMKKDKKNNNGEIQFALIKQPGKPVWDIAVEQKVLAETAKLYIDKYN